MSERSRYRVERSPPSAAQRLWVVIPAHNEAAIITGALDSLASQSDPNFSLVIVDNASTDDTAAVVARWAEHNPGVDLHLLSEPQKGTGAAADTGFRYAIDNGADWIGRTDADCVVATDWVAAIKRGSQHAHLLGGKTRARTDDIAPRPSERVYLPATVLAARWFGRLRPSNRSPDYLCPYVMCVGNNLAVAATIYERAGGFPRRAIEDLPIPNDRALVNRVRRITPLVRYAPRMVAYNSIRRLRRYGLVRTLRWYASHTLDTDRFEIDVR